MATVALTDKGKGIEEFNKTRRSKKENGQVGKTSYARAVFIQEREED